jgi:AcrR family transcriptional regulator
MPRTEEENLRIREEQKKNILDAALRVIARKGLAATKMADISAEACVSYGLAYHYFPNKEQILAELLTWVFEKNSRMAQQALEMPGTPLDRLHWFISARLQALQEKPELLMVFNQAHVDEMTHCKWREAVQKHSDLATEVVRRLIVEGQTAGQIAQDDPDQLVMALLACIKGLIVSAIYHNHEQSFPDVDIILRLLKP